MILIIDDERAISETIEFALQAQGFSSSSCITAQEGFELFERLSPELVILDVGLPDYDGFELCKKIRQRSMVPIIFLTARSDEIDRILGLELGGDDYVSKPFSPRELVSRVKTVLRRSEAQEQRSQKSPKPIEVNVLKNQVTYFGVVLDLTPYEFKILSLLVRIPGRVFSRSEIMDRLWECPDMSLERTIDAHVKSLRAKLKQVRSDVDAIVTHRGFGYALKEEW
jgi:two-component system catabolic regulation response regulator CreB